MKYDNQSNPIIYGVQQIVPIVNQSLLQSTVDQFYDNNNMNFEYLDWGIQGNIHGYSNQAFPQVSQQVQGIILLLKYGFG